MLMPERSFSSGNYRFGYQGQEKTDEISGSGNHNTALFWEYDSRLTRRWNLDPVDQVNISNYAVNGLNPILYNDPDGDLFGIKGFGSTSEQRDAARKFAKEHNGEINGLFKKSINVTYQGYDKLIIPTSEKERPWSITLIDIEKKQHFNNDGSLYDDNSSIRSYEPSTMENWGNSDGFIGQASYSIANSLYTVPQLFTQPFTGGFYSLDGSEQKRGSSELIGNFVMGASSLVPAAEAKYALGPMKNWLRVGPSYSIEGSFKTISIRWGAGGSYWKKIPSTTLQNLNRGLRETKIPLNNWRTADQGHLHLWKR